MRIAQAAELALQILDATALLVSWLPDRRIAQAGRRSELHRLATAGLEALRPAAYFRADPVDRCIKRSMSAGMNACVMRKLFIPIGKTRADFRLNNAL